MRKNIAFFICSRDFLSMQIQNKNLWKYTKKKQNKKIPCFKFFQNLAVFN